MHKYFLGLALALGCMNGATISTYAHCTGTGDVYGTTGASCTSNSSPPSYAGAFIVANPVYQDSVNLRAESYGSAPHYPDGSFGSATFIDDYVLTITGGTGQGFFVPCLFAGAQLAGSQVGPNTSASFGDVSVSGYRVGNCGLGIANSYLPFTFGVPQTFTISLESLTTEGQGGATLTSFQFSDAFGNPLTDIHFTLAELPEPSTFFLCLGGLALLFPFRRAATRWLRRDAAILRSKSETNEQSDDQKSYSPHGRHQCCDRRSDLY